MTGGAKFLVYCCLNLLSGSAQLAGTGQPQTRNIGPATFYYAVAPDGSNVLCTFLWKDSLIGLTSLDRKQSAVSWYYGPERHPGKCLLQLQLPAHSGDSARLLLQLLPGSPPGDDETSYAGRLASWVSEATSQADSLVFQLTPTATVVTRPLGTARNNASVTIYNGPMLMYTVTLTQAAPFATCQSDLTLGDFTISEGMQLTLQIPGAIQQGSVRMQATFSTPTIPRTSINSFVATWDP